MKLSLRNIETGEVISDLQPRGQLISIGRDEDAVFSLNSDAVSFEHAEIVVCDRLLGFRDCGSTNGSFLNGRQCYGGVLVPLRTGDELKLANTSFVVEEISPDVASVDSFARLVLSTLDDTSTEIIEVTQDGFERVFSAKDGSGGEFVISYAAGALTVSPTPASTGAYVNGEGISGSHQLSTGELAHAGALFVTVFLPDRQAKAGARSPEAEVFVGGSPREVPPPKKQPKSMPFGNADPAGPDSSYSFNQARRATTAMMQDAAGESIDFRPTTPEGKLLLAAIASLCLALCFLMASLLVS